MDVHSRRVVARLKRRIAIPEEITAVPVARKRLAELLCRPLGRRMVGHTDVHHRRRLAVDHETNSRRQVAVGTTKKSAAAICPR
jgi:hypothetical protein